MNDSTRHLPYQRLADLAEDRATPEDRRESMAHLSSCLHCARELQRLGHVVGLMKTDTAENAPRDVIAYAINIFRQPADARERSRLRRIVAALSFDSLSAAPAFGVRSGQTATRQLIYSAEENDIDLRITLKEDRWIVAGQVLRPDCAGGQVALEGAGGSTTMPLNELCEFMLPSVPPGNYLLRVRLADVEVEIPELKLKG